MIKVVIEVGREYIVISRTGITRKNYRSILVDILRPAASIR